MRNVPMRTPIFRMINYECRHVILLDTSGSFKLAIRLPTKDYQPKPIYSHKQAQKKWRDKKESKEWFNNYRRKWRKNLPEEQKERHRLQKNAYMLEYYQRNRQHILDYHKQYYRKKRKESNILEEFNNDRK